MFSAKEFNNTIKNSSFYDVRLEYQNLNYDELLNMIAANKLVFDELNKRCSYYKDESAKLKISLDILNKKNIELSAYIENLENSLLAIKI